jgi:hypothetical protein
MVEEASYNGNSSEDAIDGIAAYGNTDLSNMMCQEMVSHHKRMSRHL